MPDIEQGGSRLLRALQDGALVDNECVEGLPSGAHIALLTLDEVAEELRVTTKTVRNWIGKGHLPAIRVGGVIRVRRSDLVDLLRPPQRHNEEVAA